MANSAREVSCLGIYIESVKNLVILRHMPHDRHAAQTGAPEVLTTPEASRKSARARIVPRDGLATSCGLWVYHDMLGSMGPGGSRLATARRGMSWGGGVAQQLKW